MRDIGCITCESIISINVIVFANYCVTNCMIRFPHDINFFANETIKSESHYSLMFEVFEENLMKRKYNFVENNKKNKSSFHVKCMSMPDSLATNTVQVFIFFCFHLSNSSLILFQSL